MQAGVRPGLLFARGNGKAGQGRTDYLFPSDYEECVSAAGYARVERGLPQGAYRISVRVWAHETANYQAAAPQTAYLRVIVR